MFDFLENVLNKKATPEKKLTREQMAEFLKTSPETLAAFEATYKTQVLDTHMTTSNLMDYSAAHAKADTLRIADVTPKLESIINGIVDELLVQTKGITWNGEQLTDVSFDDALPAHTVPITPDSFSQLPGDLQPQLTGQYMLKDMPDETCSVLLYYFKKWQETGNSWWYNMFRQGLDILDLDPITYEMLSCNQTTMSHWLPALTNAVAKQSFFKVPKTTVIKVPIALLQLTRTNELPSLTPTTLQIIDRYCMRAFDLDPENEYFVKTGTFSSKFDFRNAHVHGEKEVRELGEYLFFLSSQAVQMASPLTSPSIYGMSTTNEWVVREFIQDREGNPCIYKGMPLHTEYRFFIDFNKNQIIGVSPYWEPEVMKKRFGHESDADSPHNIHDYMIYLAHEETLMGRYHANVDMLREKLDKLIPNIALSGQWSLDVMQNGNDFYLIDMALAADSALRECVPDNLLDKRDIKQLQTWIPKIQD